MYLYIVSNSIRFVLYDDVFDPHLEMFLDLIQNDLTSSQYYCYKEGEYLDQIWFSYYFVSTSNLKKNMRRWIFYEILAAKQSFERHDFVDTHTHLFWFYISLNLFGPRLVHDFYRFSMHVKEKTLSILNIGFDRTKLTLFFNKFKHFQKIIVKASIFINNSHRIFQRTHN